MSIVSRANKRIMRDMTFLKQNNYESEILIVEQFNVI